MKLWKAFGNVALGLAAVGMTVPSFARAEGISAPQAASPVILDVQLHEGGTLVGQVLTAEGNPAPGMEISVQTGGREVARATTDELGRYQARGLTNGVYQVMTAEGGAVYRLWTAQAAPPSAQPGALMITGDAVRGKGKGGGYFRGGLLSNPWVLGGIAAAAIIGPIIATNDDDRRPASPN